MKSHKKQFLLVIGLILTLIPSNITPMSKAASAAATMTPEQRRRALVAKQAIFKKAQQEKAARAQTAETAPAEKWYIYGAEGEQSKIPVDLDILKLSKTLANMLEDLSGTAERTIPLTNSSIATIKTVFGILPFYDENTKSQSPSLHNRIQQLSFEQLTNAIALLQWLDIPGELFTIFVQNFTTKASKNSDQSSVTTMLTTLNSDLRKQLILKPIIDTLQNQMLKNNRLYPTTLTGHEGKGINVEFSKDGKVAVTSAEGERNNVITWNAQTGQKLRTFTISEGDIEFVQINHDGTKILIIATKNELNVQEFFNDQQEKQPNAPSKEIIILLDAFTGKQIKIENLPDTQIYEAAFSEDGKRIIAAVGHEVVITDVNQQNENKAFIVIADGITGNTIATHEMISSDSDWEHSPNGTTLLVRFKTDLILYNLVTGEKIATLTAPTQRRMDDRYYSWDGTKIITYDATTQTAFIWNGKTGAAIAQLADISSIPIKISINLNHDGTKIVTGDTKISIWDIATKKLLLTLDGKQGQINSVQYSQDGTTIASTGYESKNIILWNATTGNQLHILNHPSNYINVTFSSDGKRIESHSSPGENETKCTVKLWSTSTGQEIHTFIAEHDLLETDSNLHTVIGPDDNNERNFILWRSFSKEDYAAFATIQNNLTIDQIGSLYQLYIAKLNGTPLSAETTQALQNLPSNIQSMANKYLKPSAVLPKVAAPQSQPLTQPAVKTQKSWWDYLKGMRFGG